MRIARTCLGRPLALNLARTMRSQPRGVLQSARHGRLMGSDAAPGEPHPYRKLFPPQPEPTEALPEEFDLIWDDGQAPIPAVNPYSNISLTEALSFLGAGFFAYFSLYQLCKWVNPQPRAVPRTMLFETEEHDS